ncbi:MAG: hypothetical protein IJ640_09520 [Prevotella sp.]|nr:hypothetical protein [Prevotella sp.]
MKEIKIQIPDGKNAEWVNGVLTLVDEPKVDNRPVTERIKTFEDACNALGQKHPFVRTYSSVSLSADTSANGDLIAYLKLRIIAAALNEGWEPQFTEDEYRWYPWFTLWTEEELADKSEEWKKERSLWLFGGDSYYGAGCGLAYARSSHVWSLSFSYLSARLAVKSEELAVYFGKQFIGIWADYFGPFGK